MYFLEGRYLEKATAWAGWNNALCSTVCCVLRFTETRRDLAIKMNISVLEPTTMKEHFTSFTIPWWKWGPAIKTRSLRYFFPVVCRRSPVHLHRRAAALLSRRHACSRDLANCSSVLRSDASVHVYSAQNYAKISERVWFSLLIVQA